MYISSNMSREEVIRLYGDSILKTMLDHIDELMRDYRSLEEELNEIVRSRERAEERTYNAIELLDDIEEALGKSKDLSTFKEVFNTLVNDSQLER